MNIGMLWFDGSKDNIIDKITRARDYYKKKYGKEVTKCYVNPKSFEGKAPVIEGLTVIPYNSILPSHFWLGNED